MRFFLSHRTSLFMALCWLGTLHSATQAPIVFPSATSCARDQKGLLDIAFYPLKEQIKKDEFVVQHNPYKKTTAKVRIGGAAVGADEVAWRKERFAKVKKAQEAFLNMTLADDEVLEIAIALSGGGYRAMVGSTGSLAAAERVELLDCVMTIASLSGSTWFLAPWIVSGLSANDYKNYLLPKLFTGLDPLDLADGPRIIEALLIKFAFDQPITAVDLYGGLLGNKLFRMCGTNMQHVYFASDIAPKSPSLVTQIEDANVPFPVYTARLANDDFPEEWFELTPYEVGSRWLGAYVPTWACGRRFFKGASIDFAVEQPLSFYMGIFGSSFSADFQEMYENLLQSSVSASIRSVLDALFSTELGTIRLTYGKINNFAAGINNSPLKSEKYIGLMDAGMTFGTPYFATYRKQPHDAAPDIIIAFDYSGGPGMHGLEMAAEYAEQKGFAFPDVSDPESGYRTITVFDQKTNAAAPTIIYLPRVVDQQLLAEYKNDSKLSSYYKLLANLNMNTAMAGYAQTANFYYKAAQALQWSALCEFNLLANIETVRSTLKACALAKRAQKNM